MRSDDLALLQLTPAQLRVFLALRHKEDRWGGVKATMDELSELTGYSRSSLFRAVTGLAENGFIAIERTKRNYGLLHNNRYRILRCVTRGTSEAVLDDTRRVTDDTSTGVLITTNKLTTITTNKLNNASPAVKQEEGETVVNRWRDDDDDVAGVGLFDSEVKTPEEKVSKRSAQTRSLRPQAEWTANDVASEFASRVYAKIRGIPGLVNTRGLSGALATNRKKFGVRAVDEMATMEKFFSDERNIATLKKFPKGAHGLFLNAVTKYLAEEHTDEQVDTTQTEQYVYASDGKQFDNSMPGRAALARYELKLKG